MSTLARACRRKSSVSHSNRRKGGASPSQPKSTPSNSVTPSRQRQDDDNFLKYFVKEWFKE